MSVERVSKAIGIDLGTTNSAVAIMDPRDTGIVIHRHADTRVETTPSCVWKDPGNGAFVVGRNARFNIGRHPSPIRSIKRRMGRQETVTLTDEEMTPEQVSALILAEMKRQIEEDVKGFATLSRQWLVDRAIVTVPAYFDQPSIEATRRAGELAGLEVLDLLHEPAAAAAYHCWRGKVASGVFLVYDLGGGTFDVAILRATAGQFEVLGISGDTMLGGDDLDEFVAELIHDRLAQAGHEIDVDSGGEETERTRALLARLGESVKVGVSQSGEYVLRTTGGLTDVSGNVIDTFEARFERAEIDALIAPTIERTIPKCFEALELAEKRAGVTLADVDTIVLAGGSTHLPLVRELVRRNLCALEPGAPRPRPDELADPRADGPRAQCVAPAYERVDAIVALGAAVRATAIGGLTVYDGAGRVRVSFRGAGATSDEETHLGGRVESLDAEVDLAGGSVRLSIPEIALEDEDELGPDGSFAFSGVELRPSAENELVLAVHDASGEVVAALGRPLTHRPDAGPTGGRSTAVLPKALLLEVTRNGRPERVEIVEAMTTLPHACEHQFRHPGATTRVLIPLYERTQMIHCIEVEVPSSLPRGITVPLRVSVDELSFITVTGSIGDAEFSTMLTAPPPREAPTVAELDALQARLRDALSYLPAGRRNKFEVEWRKTWDAYLVEVARGDRDKVIHVVEDLEDIVQRAEAEGPLKPPKATFDALVAKLHESNRQLGEIDANHDAAEMRGTIELLREAGEQAFADRDQGKYAWVFGQLQEHLAFLDDRPSSDVIDIPLEQQAMQCLVVVAQRLQSVLGLAQARGAGKVERELEGLARELEGLRARVADDALGVLRKALHIELALQQIEARLLADDDDDGRLLDADG